MAGLEAAGWPRLAEAGRGLGQPEAWSGAERQRPPESKPAEVRATLLSTERRYLLLTTYYLLLTTYYLLLTTYYLLLTTYYLST
jgi:hypothetical protein